MDYILEWLKGLLRFENIIVILGTLKRRILRQDHLQMRIDLNESARLSQIWSDLDIRGYSEDLERECISLLNSVGSLGLWNQSNFRQNILLSMEDPKKDIFCVHSAGSVVGISVLHKRSQFNNLREIGYVAVRPEYRGKKLGYKLLMYILAEMGRRHIYHAYVRVNVFRIQAIKTYLNVGFHPYIRNENEKNRWLRVMKKLTISKVNNSKEVGHLMALRMKVVGDIQMYNMKRHEPRCISSKNPDPQ